MRGPSTSRPVRRTGADIDQRYLPDALEDRRYYVPSDRGSERRIGELMDERRARREASRPRRVAQPGANAMDGIGGGMKAHTEARKRLADTQRKDAGG